MKKILLIMMLAIISWSVKAQFVTIPDAHFVAYLQANFPGCMSGNQMDTTCVGITNAVTVNCANDSIADLTGIQYFDNLDTLYCSHNLLTSLPALPNTLTTLGCDYNQLTSLPTLPNSLQVFNCYFNQLTVLPALPNSINTLACGNNQLASLPTLPNFLLNLFCEYNLLTILPNLPNIINFDCNNNQLTSLPTLPNSLGDINCSYNLLTSLPTLPNLLSGIECYDNQLTNLPILPSSLTVLYCDRNQLTNLPAIPNSLINLGCGGNLLSSLPILPNSLQILDCNTNQFTNLPTLPSLLAVLSCYNNQLTNLPTLPTTLVELDCYNNLLTNLPSLPNTLQALQCQNNSITCFPMFPSTIAPPYYMNISNNPFTCLPNYVTGMYAFYLAYPLCTAGNLGTNPNNCSGSSGIVGYSYKDINADCSFNTGDSTIINVNEKLYDNTSTLIGQTFSAINGIYDFPDSAGTYMVMIDTANVPYVVQCAYPGVDSTVVLTAANPLQTSVNFSVTCKPGFDVGVQSVVAEGNVFPGQLHTLKLVAGDLSNWYNLHCASGISGQVVISISGPVTYNSITAGALSPAIAGNVYTYSIADFGAVNISTAFGLVLATNTTAQNGDTICVSVSVSPASGDNNVSNNTYNYCYNVVNSFDPNKKETYPVNVGVGFDDYFTYTIHFQNTGSASAINIHLQDTLDANLDLRTFQVINYSHYNTTWLTGNKLSVNFPNIQLPDSTSNFNGSQGFIQYRIKPLAGLPGGTMIHNTASIYFDYNAPIVTNTTVNEFMVGLGIDNYKTSTLSVYPNPGKGKYFIEMKDGDVSGLKVEVSNVLGEMVYQCKMVNTKSEIDLSGEPNGIYFIRVVGGTQALNQRIVKQ